MQPAYSQNMCSAVDPEIFIDIFIYQACITEKNSLHTAPELPGERFRKAVFLFLQKTSGLCPYVLRFLDYIRTVSSDNSFYTFA